MVNYKYENMFAENSIKREIKIAFDGGSLGNDDLHNEEFTLTEGLCSENELRFGCCESSELKFRVTNAVGSLKNRKITVSSIMAGHTDDPFQFGKYTVESDAKSGDRRYRDITAYDQMHDVANAEVSAWYNGLSFPLSLLDFRNSFCQYMGIDHETVSLANDAMMVAETIKPSELSGKTVLEAICEINGCFGHFGRDGKLHYVHLKKMIKGLYPQTTLYPNKGLYPHGAKNVSKVYSSSYISCQYEDYICQSIDKLQIRQNENDIGAVSGTGNNCYVVENNFLVYGMSAEDLQTVADNLLPVISGVWYRPAQVVARANPCLEVGDGIILNTREADVYTYILERKLTGIQNIRDSYSADGEEYRSKQVNGVMSDIKQLRGKTNELERNVEETRSEIKDVESGLDTKITQNAGKIEAEAKRATEAEENLSSRISQTAEQITSEVNRAQGEESKLSSRISQTAESINAEVTRAQGVETDLSAAISVQAEQIKLKVSKGDVSSQLSVESGQVSISGNRFVLEADNCSISADGTITASNAVLNGSIKSVGEDGNYTEISSGKIEFYNENVVRSGFIRGSGEHLLIDANSVSVTGMLLVGNGATNLSQSYVKSIATTTGSFSSKTVITNSTLTVTRNFTTGNVTDVKINNQTALVADYPGYGTTFVKTITPTGGFLSVSAGIVTSFS